MRSLLSFLIIGTLFFTATSPVLAQSCLCTCTTTEGTNVVTDDIGFAADPLKCKSACETDGKKMTACSTDAGVVPATCFTAAECSASGGVLGTTAPLECPTTTYYCYPRSDTALSIPVLGLETVTDAPTYIATIYRYGTSVVVVVAIVMMMIGGIWYIVGSAAGDVKKAKEMITNAIVGVIIALCAVLMLATVNPRLTSLRLPGVEMIRGINFSFAVKRCNDYLTQPVCIANPNNFAGDCTWDGAVDACYPKRPTTGTLRGYCSNGSDESGECGTGLTCVGSILYGIDATSARGIEGYFCTDGLADSPCAGAGDCQSGLTCDALIHACVGASNKPSGAECTEPSECASAWCQNGLCALRLSPGEVQGCGNVNSESPDSFACPPGYTCDQVASRDYSGYTNRGIITDGYVCCQSGAAGQEDETKFTAACNGICKNDEDCAPSGGYCWEPGKRIGYASDPGSFYEFTEFEGHCFTGTEYDVYE